MFFVGLIENSATTFMGCKEFDSGELVEFFPDRIRRYIEFFGQFPQVGAGVWIKEKTDQQLDTGFRRDESCE